MAASPRPADDVDAMLAEIEAEAYVDAAPADAHDPFVEVFPGIRVDANEGVIEFEGVVPIQTRVESAPDVYLEVIVCTPDSKEHESLVMADVRPSHLHAALLLAGVEPGSPGRWTRDGQAIRPVPASGGRVRVELIAPGSAPVPPSAWMRPDVGAERPPSAPWVFAGSRVVDRDGDGLDEYEADRTGLLVGLHTFGSEVVGWTHAAHPDSSVEAPAWLAKNDTVPAFETPVTVRLSRVRASGQTD